METKHRNGILMSMNCRFVLFFAFVLMLVVSCASGADKKSEKKAHVEASVVDDASWKNDSLEIVDILDNVTRSFNDIEYSYNPPLSAEYKQLMARAGEIIDAITAATGEEWNDDWDCVTRLDWLEAGVDPEIVEYSIIKYGCSGNGADKKVEVVVEFEDPEFMGYLSTIKTIFVFEAGKWVIDNVDSGKEFLREFIYENS